VHHIARVVDYLLCLFPFEPPLFQAAGLPAAWVGHPVAESGIDAGDGPAFRHRHGLAADATLLLLLAGSRAGEVHRLLPVFRDAAGRLPAITAIVPIAPGVTPMVAEALRGWAVPHRLLTDPAEKPDAFAAADLALAASGTVTLELALATVPSVVAYRVNLLTALIGSAVLRVPHVGLANILCGRELMPEYLQWRATPAALAAALDRLRRDDTARARQIAARAEVHDALAPPGPPPSAQAAAAVLEILERRR
jgi:lipid-A-disaccharide synthase